MGNYRNVVGNAIPAYIVATPPITSNPPNKQNNINSAIPVNISLVPPPNGYSGRIPVRIVVGPPVPPYGTNQLLDVGAIPVYTSASPKALPVWRVN